MIVKISTLEDRKIHTFEITDEHTNVHFRPFDSVVKRFKPYNSDIAHYAVDLDALGFRPTISFNLTSDAGTLSFMDFLSDEFENIRQEFKKDLTPHMVKLGSDLSVILGKQSDIQLVELLMGSYAIHVCAYSTETYDFKVFTIDYPTVYTLPKGADTFDLTSKVEEYICNRLNPEVNIREANMSNFSMAIRSMLKHNSTYFDEITNLVLKYSVRMLELFNVLRYLKEIDEICLKAQVLKDKGIVSFLAEEKGTSKYTELKALMSKYGFTDALERSYKATKGTIARYEDVLSKAKPFENWSTEVQERIANFQYEIDFIPTETIAKWRTTNQVLDTLNK